MSASVDQSMSKDEHKKAVAGSRPSKATTDYSSYQPPQFYQNLASTYPTEMSTDATFVPATATNYYVTFPNSTGTESWVSADAMYYPGYSTSCNMFDYAQPATGDGGPYSWDYTAGWSDRGAVYSPTDPTAAATGYYTVDMYNNGVMEPSLSAFCNSSADSNKLPISSCVYPASDGWPRHITQRANRLNGVRHEATDVNTVAQQLEAHYNPLEFQLDTNSARYFVIKSYSEEDVHRSIKYGIWCSTEYGNKRLDTAYHECQLESGHIYLLFSVNGSGHFCGLAEMLSPVDYNVSSSVWVQNKWRGQFKVRWIYVKDVPNSQLRHVRLENNEGKPVTNSRDTQEIPADKADIVVRIIHEYRHCTSIFDDFVHYELQQQQQELNNMQPTAQQQQQQQQQQQRSQAEISQLPTGQHLLQCDPHCMLEQPQSDPVLQPVTTDNCNSTTQQRTSKSQSEPLQPTVSESIVVEPVDVKSVSESIDQPVVVQSEAETATESIVESFGVLSISDSVTGSVTESVEQLVGVQSMIETIVEIVDKSVQSICVSTTEIATEFTHQPVDVQSMTETVTESVDQPISDQPISEPESVTGSKQSVVNICVGQVSSQLTLSSSNAST